MPAGIRRHLGEEASMAKKRRKKAKAAKKKVVKTTATRPLIGFLYSGSKGSLRNQFAAFHKSLKKAGYVEGQNVDIIYHSAEDAYTVTDYHVLDDIVRDFVKSQVQVIVAAGGPVAAVRAQQVTTTIPIVFTTVATPIKYGLVDDLAHPTTNATGTAGLTTELDAARLEKLTKLLSNLATQTVGVLVNPNRPLVDKQVDDLNKAATDIGLKRPLAIAKAGAENELAAALQGLSGVAVLLVTADPFFNSRRKKVLDQVKKHLPVPAIYQWREFVEEGGLMSYGPSIVEAYGNAGNYVGRILTYQLQPPHLPPVIQIDPNDPEEIELVINSSTADDLGLDIPYSLLSLADEVIE
jgi:putative ABC transport system substrate-binding protein